MPCTNVVARLWTPSNNFTSLVIKWGFHTGEQYSRCGLTKLLYNAKITSGVLLTKLRLIFSSTNFNVRNVRILWAYIYLQCPLDVYDVVLKDTGPQQSWWNSADWQARQNINIGYTALLLIVGPIGLHTLQYLIDISANCFLSWPWKTPHWHLSLQDLLVNTILWQYWTKKIDGLFVVTEGYQSRSNRQWV